MIRTRRDTSGVSAAKKRWVSTVNGHRIRRRPAALRLVILIPFRAAGSAFIKSMRPDAATADDPAATAWHACTLDEVAGQLATDPIRGLAAAEAARRRAVHGANALTEPPAEPAWCSFCGSSRNS